MLRATIGSLLIVLIAFAVPLAAQESDDSAVKLKTVKLKTLNDHFPFVVPDSVDGWNRRADSLRRRVLVSTGLWPMPEKTPITPVLHGKIVRDGFTVEKVYFESLPGHFVTGMLFRPAAENQNGMVNGKRPAVLSPHGHGGRTMRLDDNELAKQIESGGEVFENSGRYPKLARCAHLARMGCVTFIFDMLGYADSQQIEYETAHRHADARPQESDREQPIFFSIEADLNLQSIMGLQTWNAIRALDFLAELPDVDAERLGVTGGSGGGTQTILLGAIDPRIKVGFPNGMVSTSMQGGCYCENCNYLRIGTGNVELAALFAPKPQGMTAANDWTKAMLTDGYPHLKQLYEMLGVRDNVMCGDVLQFPHNYNYVTRSMMYPWMAKHLGLPDGTPLVETDFQPLTETDMKVWGDDHPAPTEVGIPHERKVLAWWKGQSERKLDAVIPDDSADQPTAKKQLAEYRDVVGGAWKVIFDRELPKKEDLEIRKLPAEDFDGESIHPYQVSHSGWGTAVKVLVLERSPGESNATTFYVKRDNRLSDGENARPRPALTIPFPYSTKLVVPMFAELSDNQELINDKRSYSALTFGYNRPSTVRQFEQLLCVVAAFSDERGRNGLMAEGNDVAAASMAAAVVAGERLGKTEIVTDGFRFDSVDHYSNRSFVPGASKYFDLPGLMSLRAPYPLTVVGESGESMDLVKRVYKAAGAADQLEVR